MPTATKFESEEVGNGFPECLSKIDVSDRGDGSPYEIWSTLGGFQSDDPLDTPTSEEVRLSLKVGMALYWNVYGLTLTASAEYADNPTFTASLTGVSMADATDPTAIGVEPRTRACESNPTATRISRDGVNTYPRCFANISRMSLVRMYRGDVTDESNFVGIGLSESASSFYVSSESGARSNCRIEIHSMIATKSVDGTNEAYDYAAVQIGDGYFVVESNANGFGTLTVDAATISASSEYTNVNGNYNTYATITDIEYYTY